MAYDTRILNYAQNKSQAMLLVRFFEFLTDTQFTIIDSKMVAAIWICTRPCFIVNCRAIPSVVGKRYQNTGIALQTRRKISDLHSLLPSLPVVEWIGHLKQAYPSFNLLVRPFYVNSIHS